MLELELIKLRLPSRTLNALEAAGIETVADLCAKRPEELLAIPYFGTGQLRAVQRSLAERGQELRPSLPPPIISARQVGQRKRRQRERAIRKREPRGREAMVAAWVKARHGAA